VSATERKRLAICSVANRMVTQNFPISKNVQAVSGKSARTRRDSSAVHA